MITRAAQLVDEVIVAVAAFPEEKPAVHARGARRARPAGDRASCPTCSVEPFDGPARRFRSTNMDATVVVKGLRAITDFEYEFQMTAHELPALPETLETRVHHVAPRSTCTFPARSCARSRAFAVISTNSFPPCVAEAPRQASSPTVAEWLQVRTVSICVAQA